VRIRTYGDPVLRRPAAPLTRITGAVRRLARNMVETMRDNAGVGLAAPQVGVGKRLIVVDVGEGLHILVNPRIVASSGSDVDWEGCLSFPGLLAEIERAKTVTVEALDLDGRQVWLDAEDFFARALQHEIDHLDGVVILDRAREVRAVEPEDTGQVEAVEKPVERTGRPLRVAFMGTPDFAVPALRALAAAGHEVVGVVTRPDRPAGRGKARRASPVKRAAEALGLDVWQGTARDVARLLPGVLAEWGAEVGVVVAFGVILPGEVLSLLPDYRGAAPIQRAIMDGRPATGVTVIQMDEGMDTGDIILQREVPLAPGETAGSLHDRLAGFGAGLVVQALDLIARGEAHPRPQPDRPAPTAPRLGPDDEVIDWSRPAAEIERQVRALDPVPGAHTFFRGRRLKVWRVAVTGGAREVGAPVDRGCPVVRAGDGCVALLAVQPAGRSRMEGSDFVNG